MCTLVILRRPDHRWPVIIGANRDEMIDRLKLESLVAQIADVAAIALIQIDVCQALNLMAIVTSSPER